MKWLIFSLMLPHLKPACIEYLWPTLDRFFDMARIFSVLLLLFLHLLKRKIPSKPVWVLFSLNVWILFSTYLHHGELRSSLLTLASMLSTALLVDFFISRPITLLKGLLPCFEITLYGNFVSVLLYYPNGMYISSINHYRSYFLGYHNSFIAYVLPAMVVALLYFSMTGEKVRPTLLIIAGVIPILITWSVTSVCGLLIFFAVLLFSKISKQQWISFPVIFITTTVIDLLISVFRVMDRVMWMARFIGSFLRKSITLTGRTFIWDKFYTLFYQSPWIGHGTINGFSTVVGYVNHTHNRWFQCLFEGGIVALIIFLVLNFIVGKQSIKYKESSNINIFLAAFAALYTLFIGEACTSSRLFMLYFLAYHIDKFETIPGAAANSLRPKSGAVQYTKKMRGYEKDERNNYPAGTASNS